MEDYRRRKKKGVVIKFDLEKAYDKTDWNFLDYFMPRKGFVRNGDLGCLDASLLLIFRLY